MKRSTVFFMTGLGILFLFVTMLSAQVPQLINYQGILKDPATADPISGSKSMTFSIYSVSSGGTALWFETQTISVDNGYFSTSLGATTLIPFSVFSGGNRYLGVKVETDAEMTPRKRLVSVGYALRSHDADKVGGQDASAFAPVVHNHDSNYYTRSELNTSDGNPPNSGSNRISWNNLKDVPAGFADGTDEVGAAGGISQVNVGTGMAVTNPNGPTTTLGLNMGHGNNIDADKLDGKHAVDFALNQELSTNDGTVNQSGDPVSWYKIKDMPAGFADGTDNAGTAGGVTQINVGAGMTVTNPTGPTTSLGLNMGHGNSINADMVDGKHASNFATVSHPHSGVDITSGKISNARLNMGSGNGLDADLVDGKHAGNFATSSHNHLGADWTGSFGWANASLKVTNLSNGPGVYGINRGGGNGVRGQTNGTGIGVYGQCDNSGPGVVGRSTSGDGVKGFGSANGVYGEATGGGGQGVFGKGIGANAEGVVGQGGSNGIGVNGMATNQPGVVGTSSNNDGVRGVSTNFSGVRGNSTNGHGVKGETSASSGSGVYGYSSNGQGVTGQSTSKNGVQGSTSGGASAFGVKGTSSGTGGTGVLGEAHNGSSAYGIWGKSTTGYAGYFTGKVQITGNISKGGGSFKIDHPLDPANKYLYHSFVESPDMMNIYNGNIALDANGEAVVTMPEWFDALNKDFRYQLTAIGAPGPNLYVAEEISDNRFSIAGGTSGMKVSWQVTGIRQDAYAKANRIPVEEDKPDQERGKYLHPKELGMSETMGIESAKQSK